MKRLKYILLIFYTFHFSNLYSEDIKDFQIEGISIGESALKYFDKNEIESIKSRGFIYSKKDFYSVTFYADNSNHRFEIYDAVQLHLKDTDKNYKIYSLGGRKYFENNFDGCVETLNTILPQIEKTFKGSKTIDGGTETWKNTEGHYVKTKSYWISLPKGAEVALECYDQPKEMNTIDGLNISLDSKEFAQWLRY